ncbi:hypothetical protein F4801DRAFT_219654 [Xylaria longipes]|nr:hypothetical protein F4801DRAFT_219654 [Xylaria longipes]RYC57080.1 hypothetical protein CHU98_g9128 [Xylaria longipes]
MPSVQPHMPTETRKGTGISGFPFLNSLSGFVASVGDHLGSAFRLGRSGDMNKPMNVGALRPMNTLSNNSTSSRTPFSHLPSSRSIPSSPPPAKRQKLDESSSNPAHSRATFAVIDPASPRKRSIGSVSIPDSQCSVASNVSASQHSVPEYYKLDYYTKPRRKRSRTNRSDRRLPGQEDVESSGSRPVPPPKSDGDITDDEVHLVNIQKGPATLHQPKHKEMEERPISEFADRFRVTESDPKQRFSKVIDKVEKKTMKRGGPDFGPDELASDLEEVRGGRPAKRLKPFSSSLSTRGNISTTRFTGAPTGKSSAAMERVFQVQDENKRNADLIIGAGLRILRGASGRCKYQANYEADPNPLYLSIHEIGHTLHPVDQEKNILLPYRYLTLNLMDVSTILRVSNEEESYIVSVQFNAVKLSNSAGIKLVIEFASKPEFSKFFQWVANYKGTWKNLLIKDCKRTKLENDLNELIERAQFHRVITDAETGTTVADDIRVIQHNHNSHVPVARMNPGIANEPKTRPRIRDGMKPSPTPRPGGGNITSSPSWDDRLASVRRQTRTTRSTFAYFSSSPEPGESEPEGWTLLNPGWEKQWRNSLVYPDTGKNRATVDKDDIQRLDEGQFLNDNIIIFYLRYLQKNLEDTNKGLARRIFFQNTFFYDKLKPTKTGQGINYDSVKTWTSKVDLFSKDFIIVPINEYTHWYVAIICNAPALLPSSAYHEQIDDNKNNGAVVTHGVEIARETSEASSQNGVPSGPISGDDLSVPAREDVVENLRRLSIDNSDQPSHETKRDMENKPEEEVGSAPTRNGHEMYVVNDVDKPEVVVEHIPTATTPQSRKKMGKRSGIGPPKYDPNQPRIITLDSLGASHSPTCSYLKQYLIAELEDKKGIEIPAPRAMGTTAKDIPEQTNHCDCGLFLLGYIQQFLLDPDAFVKNLLQRDNKIPWRLDPSALRNNIRDLIFSLQKEQQEREDVAQEKKRQAKMGKPQTRGKETPTRTTAPATILSDASSTPETTTRGTLGDKVGTSKSPPALLGSRPSSSRGSSVILGEVLDPPISYGNANHDITKVQMTTSNAQNDDSGATQQGETSDRSNLEKIQAKLRLDPHVVTSPRKTKPVSDHETHHQTPSTISSSPVKGQASKCHSLSPVAEGIHFQNGFLHLLSETPSSKGSRGATPLDPVVVDDSDTNRRARVWPSPQRQRDNQQKRQLVVEIPSASIHSQSPGQSSKTDDRKQTGHQSSYFANRLDGERVTSAKLRMKPQDDVIDLSDD